MHKRLSLGGFLVRGCVPSAEAALGEPAGVSVPGVLFAAATFHLLAPGCQNDVEIAQIIKQLQGPILGHREGTFFL